jgi:hypothetical protein
MNASRDLLILAADKDAKFGIESLLTNRRNRLGIREITFECIVHPDKDSGVRSNPLPFLRNRLNDFERALLIFDFEGSGSESRTVTAIELKLEDLLSANGWQDRCCVVAIVPELESWIWDGSLNLCKATGLVRAPHEIKPLLVDRSFIAQSEIKPARPKEAFEFLLRNSNIKRSSSLFSELAKKITIEGCTDPAFLKFLAALRKWFPAE